MRLYISYSLLFAIETMLFQPLYILRSCYIWYPPIVREDGYKSFFQNN